MKLYHTIREGNNSSMELVETKKRSTAKDLLKSDPKNYFKSFGKARKSLITDFKTIQNDAKAVIKKIRKIKKNALKPVKPKKISTDASKETSKGDKKEKSSKKSSKE
jgi:hypothetical protein